jgi:hypothetical protein
MADGLRNKETGSTTNILHKSQQALGGFGFDSDPKKKGTNANTSSIEKKRATLDVRHRFLLEKFATVVDAKPADLETSLLLGNKLDYVNSFFQENGLRRVLFFWQALSKVCTVMPCSVSPVLTAVFTVCRRMRPPSSKLEGLQNTTFWCPMVPKKAFLEWAAILFVPTRKLSPSPTYTKKSPLASSLQTSYLLSPH